MTVPLLQFVDRPGLLDLGWGHPHPDALPVRAWAQASVAALEEFGWQALAYGYGAGPGPLIRWLAERTGCEPAETFVTAGASHALELVCAQLTRRDDVVVVDAPTYHLALRILADHGVELVPAATDADGLDPAGTAALIERLRRQGRRVPLLYLVPTFANPTGQSLAGDRRRELVAVARASGVTVVEDDTYRELVYDGTVPPPLWNLAEAGEVIRIGSFAKTVGPGLRLGWLNATPGFVARLTDLGYVDSGGGVNHTTALTMACFGTSGAYDAHLTTILDRYRCQRDALVGALGPVPVPAGGWFVWMRVPVPARTLLAAAEERGVSFVPGDRFFTDGRGDGYARLSFSMLDPADLVEAANRLNAVLERPAGIEPASSV